MREKNVTEVKRVKTCTEWDKARQKPRVHDWF